MPTRGNSDAAAQSAIARFGWSKLIALTALCVATALTAAAFIKSALLDASLEELRRPSPPAEDSYTCVAEFTPYPNCESLYSFGRPQSSLVLVGPRIKSGRRVESSDWQIWDIESAKHISNLATSHELPLRPFDYSADGKWFCVHTNEPDDPYRLISALDGKVYPVADYQHTYGFLARFLPVERERLNAAFSSDSERLVVASSKNRLAVIDVATRELLAERDFPGTERIVDIIGLPGNARMACLTIENELVVFDSEEFQFVSRYQTTLDEPEQAKLLATAYPDQVLINGILSNNSHRLDLETGDQTLLARKGRNVLCKLPGRDVVLVGDVKGDVYFVDYMLGEVISGFVAHPEGNPREDSTTSYVINAGSSPDGSILWTIGLDNKLKIWRQNGPPPE